MASAVSFKTHMVKVAMNDELQAIDDDEEKYDNEQQMSSGLRIPISDEWV